MNLPLKLFFRYMSPAGRGARLSVLNFHRVLPQPDPLFPDEVFARRFDSLCRWLAAWFNVLPLDEAVSRLAAGTLPTRAASITFDDGYADNFHVAMPILQQHHLTATFFIATGFLNGGRMWNDSIIEAVRGTTATVLDLAGLGLGLGCHGLSSTEQKRAAIAAIIGQVKYRAVDERVLIGQEIARIARVRLPDDLMMTSGEVKAMRRSGMQIGAHTVSHPILARLTEEATRREIQESRHFLEQLLGERVGLFAYPNGKPGEDYTAQSVDVVRALGFDAAVSTQWGASGQMDDPLQIRRFTPWDHGQLRFGVRLLANLRGA